MEFRVLRAGPPEWTCQVTVTAEDGSSSSHEVTVEKEDLDRWGGGLDVVELVRRSFEFLLAREPKESILRRFDLRVIQRYFPDYDRAMRR